MKELILGGVRSGKSHLAEKLALQSGKPVTYIATATAEDDEMRDRITAHQQRRSNEWMVIEEPLYLARTLKAHDNNNQCMLVDCLTLWLSNLLCKNDDALLQQETGQLLDTLSVVKSHIILVSNETNMGIIPANELSRRFCDTAGNLHQQLAAQCDRVILTVAGLPHVIKGSPL